MKNFNTVPVSGPQVFLVLNWLCHSFAGRRLLKVRVVPDPGGTAEKHETNSGSAMSTSREALAFKNSSRMIFAVQVMSDGVNPRFRDLVPGFEDLLSLRCSLHLVAVAPEVRIVYRTTPKILSSAIRPGP